LGERIGKRNGAFSKTENPKNHEKLKTTIKIDTRGGTSLSRESTRGRGVN